MGIVAHFVSAYGSVCALPYVRMYICMFVQVEEVVEWLWVVLQCLCRPVLSVTELAVVWSLARRHCLSPLSVNPTDRYM